MDAILMNAFQDLTVHAQGECSAAEHECCAICLDQIALQETALVKGCDHAYCVMCILQWATYKKEPTCPQCKQPFDSLHIHRSLDGSIHDYMFEESVRLLLRASWFRPLSVDHHSPDEFYPEAYDEPDDDLLDDLEVYLGRSSNLNMQSSNRRWGNNVFVRAGKQEARPIHEQPRFQDSVVGPSSRGHKQRDASASDHVAAVGRRAKRALKREAEAAKHQQLLVKLGRD